MSVKVCSVGSEEGMASKVSQNSSPSSVAIEALTRSLSNASIGSSTSSNGSKSGVAEIVHVIIEDKEILCDKRLLVKHSKYFKARFAFESDNLSSNSKSGANGNVKSSHRVRLKGGLDYDSAKVILSGNFDSM